MNKDIARYRWLLKRNLHCGIRKRRELLKQFNYALSDFMDEYSVPTYSQLSDAFGPPEEMACVLMENVSAEEREQYRIRQIVLKVLTAFVVILFALASMYVFFLKQYTIIEFYDTLIPVQTVISQWGY